jgi:RluA family pseudouridine synthase
MTTTIPVLYEDDALLAVDKPSGVVVIPARDEPADECVRALLERARGERLWVVHRVDRDTSGVLLFARTAEAHKALCASFEARSTQKEYALFCRSERALSASGTIDVALHTARKGKMRPALAKEEGALASETRWEREHHARTLLGFVSRVRAKPTTGRQHQLRVHFRSIEAPFVVDPVYGGAASRAEGALGPGSPALSRLTLHASKLSLPHPTRADERLSFEAPLPADLQALDAWMRAQPADAQS